MNFHILTLFPEMVMNGLNTSIIGRAINKGLLSIEAVNIRDYAFNKHQSVDDYPYGGGAGMLMQAEPVYLAYEAVAQKIAGESAALQGNVEENAVPQESAEDSAAPRENAGDSAVPQESAEDSAVPQGNAGESAVPKENAEESAAPRENAGDSAVVRQGTEHTAGKKPRVVYLSPQGDVFTQKMAEELAQEEDLILLCGHYEGIDERVLEEIVTDYVSIGDYVLTGGELPAMVMVDTISRLVPGVLHNDVSAEFESFQDNLLEYPQYSRPEEWHGKKVPEVLLSGHHANIEKWRREQSILRTRERRPDLLEKCELTEKERQMLKNLPEL